jgi:pimeloyl-ACP methyl ester carboxylesterase
VLDAEDIEKALFWGYSMGGRIGFGMAKYAPRRLHALIIGGAHPFASDGSGFRQWLRGGITGGPDVLVAGFQKIVGPISDAHAAALREADLEAWLASVTEKNRGGIEEVLENVTMPTFFYAGEADPIFAQARSVSERILGARFLSLPGLSHLEAFVKSNSVLPPIMEFIGALQLR